MPKEKVVLAYSGGLDTSVCIRWLAEEKNLDVITYTADLGQVLNPAALKKKAILSGSKKVYIEDLREEFLRRFAFPALQAGACYEGKYFLATALGRPLIAKRLGEIATKENARFVSHGCTGKGNDQVRIEVAVHSLFPSLKVIAPLRQWDIGSREEEIDYAKRYHIPVTTTKENPYSIDRNLWGISIECGNLEDPWNAPRQDIYQLTKSPEDAPKKPTLLEIGFNKGSPISINGKRYKPVVLVSKLNKIGGKNAVGRVDLVENRLVGIKSREVYECPAAAILHMAHREIESLVHDRELMHFKEGISRKYSELVYYGLWYSPLREALDAFIKETQRHITGTVRLKLYKGNCTVTGRKSPHSIYKYALATYDKGDKFDHKAADGFIHLWALPFRRRNRS